jgi:hypothetical protein
MTSQKDEAVAVADLLSSQGVFKESNSTMVNAVLDAAEEIIAEHDREVGLQKVWCVRNGCCTAHNVFFCHQKSDHTLGVFFAALLLVGIVFIIPLVTMKLSQDRAHNLAIKKIGAAKKLRSRTDPDTVDDDQDEFEMHEAQPLAIGVVDRTNSSATFSQTATDQQNLRRIVERAGIFSTTTEECDPDIDQTDTQMQVQDAYV